MILRIKCPQCRESFEVSEDLKGRTVECGSCESRFQVNESVMASERERFYPDEVKKDVDLSRFGRSSTASAPVEFRTMEYDNSGKTTFVGPMPPVRLFAIVAGLLALAGSAALLYFGSQESGTILKDVEKPQRYLLAGFFGVVVFGLLSWGMLRKRFLGIFLGLVGAGGLVALAHYMPVYRTPEYASGSSYSPLGSSAMSDDEDPPAFFPGITDDPATIEEVRETVRWDSTIAPLMALGGGTEAGSHVAAIWIPSMEEFHSLQIKKYLEEALGLPNPPYFRTLKGDGLPGGLFVMSGVPLDLDQVEAVAGRLGSVDQVLPDLRVLQLDLNPAVLGGDISNELTAKLVDFSDGAAYSLNFKELISLDKRRVKDAIKRLSQAEPLRMRKDITVRLVGLLGQESDYETQGLIVDALLVWSEEDDGADQALLNQIFKLRADNKPVPESMLRFLAERKTAAAAPVMVDLWSREPGERQRFLETYGSGAASLLVPFLKSADAGQSRSAARILGQIGTRAELPDMRAALADASDDTLKISLEQAIQQIERR